MVHGPSQTPVPVDEPRLRGGTPTGPPSLPRTATLARSDPTRVEEIGDLQHPTLIHDPKQRTS